ncbi:hypothetical protein MNBD_NITROSPINAE04-1950 [hydrothermal vent metagenome]|uniref:Uncharacterized protein n=1 Tax=hydrothermal vent metagenome TaxID=652676 RepID=A0A3B1BT23_9ZZZZ
MSSNHPSQLTDNQKATIRHGVLNGIDWTTVWEQVSYEKPVTKSLVQKEMERIASERNVKYGAKREGALLVQEFLQKVKDGVEVDDMAAALEQAVYRDILRRYADAADPLITMTMEQVLKIDMSYRSARLAKHKHESTSSVNGDLAIHSAKVMAESFDRLLDIAEKPLREKIKKLRKPLVKWAEQKYGKENVNEIEKERNEIERLAKIVGYKRAGGNGKGAPRNVAVTGLSG